MLEPMFPALEQLGVGASDAVGRDFLCGPKTADGEDSFVLCQINISCVVPFPPTAVPRVAAAAKAHAAAHKAACGASAVGAAS
jgi:hypothetical protein